MILWGSEHHLRAANLAAAVKEAVLQASTVMGPQAVIPACTDSTLTIWGHGGPTSFADLDPKALADLIKAWKSKNPSLVKVELVTCDARHSPADHDTFSDQLMPFLINASTGKVLVNVLTLPRGGKSATTSILYANEAAGSDGYYFIAADSDAALQAGVSVFQAAYAAVPAGTPVGAMYKTLLPIAKAANDKAAMRGALSYVTSGGQFPALRSLLVNVTAYVVDGKTYAVPKSLS